MKCSLCISNFLEVISSLSHSIVFLYFFAFITEEGFFFISLAILWNSAFKWAYYLEEKLWSPRQHIKKQKYYFANKGPSCQSYGFSSSHVYESWTIKKIEYQRIDVFELWCWKRLLRVPWTARRSSQSILKEISPDNSLEGLMLKLKLQYLGHLMWRTDSFEKSLMLGKIEGRRRRGQLRTRWLDDITDSMDMSLRKLWELVIDRRRKWQPTPVFLPGESQGREPGGLPYGVTQSWTRLTWLSSSNSSSSREAWCAAVHGVAKSRTWLSDWTEH